MPKLRPMTTAALVGLWIGAASVAVAQTSHDAHHPEGTAAATDQPTRPPQAQP